MLPVPPFNFSIEAEAHAHPAAVAGEELYVLGVFSLFEGIAAAACAKEISGLRIDRGPLESFA